MLVQDIALKTATAFTVFGVSALGIFFIFDPTKDIGVDITDSSLCLSKMEQKLKISDLPVASKKIVIVEGVNCLKESKSDIDLEKPEVKNLFSASNELINRSEVEAKDIEEFLAIVNSLQFHLKEISQYKNLRMALDFLFGIALVAIQIAIVFFILFS